MTSTARKRMFFWFGWLATLGLLTIAVVAFGLAIKGFIDGVLLAP